ncbi:hypothetical protein ACP275_14G201100 [Erythranthe tilingii]
MASSWHTCPTCGRSSPSPSLQTTTEGELDSPFDNRCWKGYGIVLYPNSVAENVEYTKSMAKDAVAFYNVCVFVFSRLRSGVFLLFRYFGFIVLSNYGAE